MCWLVSSAKAASSQAFLEKTLWTVFLLTHELDLWPHTCDRHKENTDHSAMRFSKSQGCLLLVLLKVKPKGGKEDENTP